MADPCGAKTRAGGKCKAPAMTNGRCRVHGGASTGPKTPNTAHNAVKHGIYTEYFTPEEIEFHDNIQLGNVDLELRTCRIRLRRALKAEADAKGEAELEEVIDRTGGGDFVSPHEEKRRVKDYTKIIDSLMARIESLEKTRAALIAASGGGGNPEDEMTNDDTFISPDEPIPQNPIL